MTDIDWLGQLDYEIKKRVSPITLCLDVVNLDVSFEHLDMMLMWAATKNIRIQNCTPEVFNRYLKIKNSVCRFSRKST